MTAVAQRDEEGPPATESAALSPTPRPIRVLHFHSSQGLYGPERWTHLVLRTIPPERAALEVLTIGTKPGYADFAEFLRIEGFTATHLPVGGKIGPEAIRAVRRVVVERRIEVLHTHGFKSDILGYLATRGLGIRLVTTPHGWCDHENFRIRAYEALGRAFLLGFDRIYPLSGHQAEFLQRRSALRSRVRCIRNAVDIDAFGDVFARRRGAETGQSAPILFVGRIGHEKGVLDLIRAMPLVVSERADARLLIAGTGPDVEIAQALATQLGVAAHIEFLGFRSDIRSLFDHASCLVLPSYSEGIPRVVMEAFSAGVPVVGTDIPGIREVVEDGKTGLLVPVGNPPALARALQRVLRDPGGARDFAAKAHCVVERDYSAARLANELVEEYEHIANVAS